MNEQYFYCPGSKEYVRAGYRWAYRYLVKTGICQRGENVNIDTLLSAKEYWRIDDSEESKWLKDGILPLVSNFIKSNRRHDIFYGEEEFFLDADKNEYWEWLDVGYLPEKSPRYFIELLKFNSWHEVEEYVNKNPVYHGNKPWWWEWNPQHDEARKYFDKKII
ncbi:MAG: hypothetical protein QNJ46_32305 [Leptolyngbyaceae cyanobacterium MO_188.B28]|nr:hypothetical protein [Leptolyngbyaceae cyanobacterium MO_188.B28]